MIVSSYLVRVEYRVIIRMECCISDVKTLSQFNVVPPAGLSEGKLGTPKCRGNCHCPALTRKLHWSLGSFNADCQPLVALRSLVLSPYGSGSMGGPKLCYR